jgi:hypothetical protein
VEEVKKNEDDSCLCHKQSVNEWCPKHGYVRMIAALFIAHGGIIPLKILGRNDKE